MMNGINTIFRLACNDIKSKYANSILGILWAFVMPLITILVFWYVFQVGLKNLPVADVPYILWFTVAYIPWIFFVDIVVSGSNSLVEYSFLVKKIKFEVELIPIVKLCSAFLVHLCFDLFLCVMYGYFGYEFKIYNLQIIYYTIAAGIYGLGLSYFLSAVVVFFKDMVSIVNICVQIGFWITPILWDANNLVEDTVKRIVRLNPMYYVVEGYRECFLYDRWFWEDISYTLYFWGITIFILIFSRIIYKRLSPFFADEV